MEYFALIESLPNSIIKFNIKSLNNSLVTIPVEGSGGNRWPGKFCIGDDVGSSTIVATNATKGLNRIPFHDTKTKVTLDIFEKTVDSNLPLKANLNVTSGPRTFVRR